MVQSTALLSATSPPATFAGDTPPSRFRWVDAAKGFAIILVVFGHTLRGLIYSDLMAWAPVTRFVDAWIYAFHMPVFFFLSGLFLFRSIGRPLGNIASDKLRTLAYPYFVWSVITLVIKATLGRVANHPYSISDLPLIFYSPIDQFWFLYALFVLTMLVSVLLQVGTKPWTILTLAILIYPGLLPISGYESAIVVETRMMAIYFALGVVFGSDFNLSRLSCIHARWLTIALASGLLISSLAGWGEFPYLPLFRFIFAVSGIVAVIGLSLLAENAKVASAIHFLGRHSLEIFLVHTIASAGIRTVLVKFAHITAIGPHLLLGTLAGLYIPIALIMLFERVGFPFGFRLPKAPRPAATTIT